MSADKDHAPGNADDHASDHADSHDGQAPATDIIPESSPQDLLLKCVTAIAAVLISGTFIWWWTLPFSADMEGHGGAESIQH
jgi:hypothetical protein